jgi:DNA-binding transcriptional ArsR family regulator
VQAPLLETGDLVQVVRDAVREEVAKLAEAVRIPQAQEIRVEVPKEVVEAISAVRDQIAAVQRDLAYVKEQVRQRKGWGARAVARGEKRVEFKEGSLYWMLKEIMKDGGEWTKEQLAEEIRRRFGKEVSGNSVSGRLSELAAAGYVAFRRQGRTWLWRWIGP